MEEVTAAPEPSAPVTTINYGMWSAEYTKAQLPAPKAAEMIEAIEHVVINGQASARATAAVNAGVFDPGVLRRLAALEATEGVLKRIANKWGDLPQWVRDVVLGTPGRKRVESGDNRADR